MNTITYLDPVESQMSSDLYTAVIDDLSFMAQFYRPGRFHKIRKEYACKDAVIGKYKHGGYLFYTGLIPKIQEICNQKNIPLSVSNTKEEIILRTSPIPENLKFRPFQEEFIRDGILHQRGIFIAPTGTGKTILGIGLVASLWENYKILWLCHTKSLMKQSAEEFEKTFGPGSVGLVGDSDYNVGKYVTIASRQTCVKHVAELSTLFDVVIVDEVHHISDFKGEYARILRQIYAPIRFGVTATRPEKKESLLAMEAFIGPVLGEFTIEEARKQGFMAEPKIRLIKLSKNMVVHDLRKYSDVYESGVVRNLEMNRRIAELVKGYSEEGKSSLIIVNQVVHGELILNMCSRLGVKAFFVNGSTESDTRTQIQKALNGKDLLVGICTAVWKEGTNIPELNVLINAAGGKSELATLQAIGRGMRKTESKEELIIHDFFNPSHRFLVEHFGHRVCLYMDNGWL